jgi:hypothetical protein
MLLVPVVTEELLTRPLSRLLKCPTAYLLQVLVLKGLGTAAALLDGTATINIQDGGIERLDSDVYLVECYW